jgi:hypothetical protein
MSDSEIRVDTHGKAKKRASRLALLAKARPISPRSDKRLMRGPISTRRKAQRAGRCAVTDCAIRETIQRAFELAAQAATIRDAIAKQLPKTVGRDHAAAHRIYVVLADMVRGFNSLEDKIAEMRSLGYFP